jgi:hypothetical protein
MLPARALAPRVIANEVMATVPVEPMKTLRQEAPDTDAIQNIEIGHYLHDVAIRGEPPLVRLLYDRAVRPMQVSEFIKARRPSCRSCLSDHSFTVCEAFDEELHATTSIGLSGFAVPSMYSSSRASCHFLSALSAALSAALHAALLAALHAALLAALHGALSAALHAALSAALLAALHAALSAALLAALHAALLAALHAALSAALHAALHAALSAALSAALLAAAIALRGRSSPGQRFSKKGRTCSAQSAAQRRNLRSLKPVARMSRASRATTLSSPATTSPRTPASNTVAP